jgi:hypothetical protein
MAQLMLMQSRSSDGYSVFEDVNYDIEEFSGKYDNTDWWDLTNDERRAWNVETDGEEWRGKEIYENDIVEVWDSIGMVQREEFAFDFHVVSGLDTQYCIDSDLVRLGSIHDEELMAKLVKSKFGGYTKKGVVHDSNV